MQEFFALLGLAFFPVTGVLVALWRSDRARAHRAEETLYDIASSGHPRTPAPSNADVMAALENMQQEINRIADAQRFTAQVLAERYERIAGRSMPTTTPH